MVKPGLPNKVEELSASLMTTAGPRPTDAAAGDAHVVVTGSPRPAPAPASAALPRDADMMGALV